MKPFIKRRSQRLLTLYPKYQLTQLVGWSLGIFLLCTQLVDAQIANSSCRPQFVLPELSNVKPDLNTTCKDPKNLVITPQQALSQLAQADVVYLGETHDNAQDHQIQLEIIQKLQQRNPKIVLAMEMFQRPYQGILDDYLAGKLNEQELLKQSEYNERWGFPWEYYAPIVQFAKKKQLPILALNTPTEVTRQVVRKGLESLTPKQRRFIPPISEIRTDDADYRQMMLDIFKQHQDEGHGSSADFERFFLAQVLWDETMAEKIAQFLQVHPDHQIIVLVGQGHIVYGYGIPNRVARQMQNKPLIQRSVLLSPASDDVANNNQPIADFIWE